ncbi:MAG: PIG-L family deacetylase [Acidobacteria bacterium]|nr:PIG-L family deacetylase [Acidobacteriota bacterium]
MALSRLLLIFAHPDDESVFAAGVARKCADEGGCVGLCTATPGERGKVGAPPVCAPADLARVRQRELFDACDLLGISTRRVLGYPDRGLAAAPGETIRRQLVEVIRNVRPHVVITFEPNGSNLHPDHVAISRFTSDAIPAAADARWFPDLGRSHAVSRLLWTLPLRPWDLLRRGDPALEPGVDVAVDVGRWAGVKADALRAHRTQHQGLTRIFFSRPDVTRLLSIELFRQAFGPPPVSRPIDDLFAGIVL